MTTEDPWGPTPDWVSGSVLSPLTAVRLQFSAIAPEQYSPAWWARSEPRPLAANSGTVVPRNRNWGFQGSLASSWHLNCCLSSSMGTPQRGVALALAVWVAVESSTRPAGWRLSRSPKSHVTTRTYP